MLLNNDAYKQDIENLTAWGDTDVTVKFARKILIKYLRQFELPLGSFTESDWGNFFESNSIATNNIRPVRSKIRKFLTQNGYSPAVIQALNNNKRCGGTNYILSFDQLEYEIHQKRMETYRSALYKMGVLDSYSSIEMGIYLIWLGLSLDEAISVKCHDFDFSNNLILFQNQKIKLPQRLSQLFYNYVHAGGYYFDNGKDEKVVFRAYDRENDVFLCKGKGGYKPASFLKKINELGYTESIIWLSGRFAQAWERCKKIGVVPLSWGNVENVELFFEFGSHHVIKSQPQLVDLKYDWERYCCQRNNLNISKNISKI